MPSNRALLTNLLSQKTLVFSLRLWVLICICVGTSMLLILIIMIVWVSSRRKSTRSLEQYILPSQIPVKSREIPVDIASEQSLARGSHATRVLENSQEKQTGKKLAYLIRSKSADTDTVSQCSSGYDNVERSGSVHAHSGDDQGTRHARNSSSSNMLLSFSPLVGLPEFSHLGWGHWFTLRDLDSATNHFSVENILGEGGYGIVYRGRLINGTEVAVKRLLNNMGQAEKEFRVEVEAIGHVRHKNLVRLLGYCIEGVQRMLVYEYVKNGNLEQWLHGGMQQHGCLSWDSRLKIMMGTAKALSYLHEAIEPKVVHRDIKSSNILLDNEFNAKVSDFGLAKLLGSGKSHVATRVMGTFGYVAPEYANTGLLNEKSDVYSFGVLMLEAMTGRDPVDYGRPANEVNLVEWLKFMVASRRAEEVVDPNMEEKPTSRALKRALLIALRCIDPDSDKRPRMGQVVRFLEAEEVPYREVRKMHHGQMRGMDMESLKDCSSSTDIDK